MIEQLIKAATCRVACGSESGTGWLIGKDRVLTARHCVLAGIEEGQPVELFFPGSGDAAVTGKIVNNSEDWDTCILSLETTTVAQPLSVSLERSREGETWQTFGYPQSKPTLGHRLAGTVAQVLETPKLKIDLDLSVDSNVELKNPRGMSGAPVICQGTVIGMILLKADGGIGALSLNQLADFLIENGVDLPNRLTSSSAPLLADREDFLSDFTLAVQERAGSYLFLEGAHGYGKSTFCRNFSSEGGLINLGAYCLSNPDNTLGANYWAQPQVFFEWLTTSISTHIIGKLPRKNDETYPEQIRKTAEYINEFSQFCEKAGCKGVFFIDGLNEIPTEAAVLDTLLGLLPAQLPPHVTVVLTAPNFATFSGRLAGKVKTRDVLNLPPLSDSSCYRFCQKALKPERRLSALVNQICEKAQGHPLYLKYLIEYANLQAINDDLDDFPVLRGPIEEYYENIWAKLSSDGDSVNLLALMARLRWAISLKDFVKILDPTEEKHFVSVMSRIRHLLADEESTAVYHASFTEFIIEQTAIIDEFACRRLAKFCLEEQSIPYCILNRVFHLLRSRDVAAFAECNQTWFDTVVTLGVEPDTLIADVDAVMKRAVLESPPDEFFRLTLLAQRVSFRYDTLFAQSARLIAEALIALERPSEALKHVLRLKTLIVGPDDALEIAFLLHRNGNEDDALELLHRIHQRIVGSYNAPMDLKDFLQLCFWHIQTIFLTRLANGWNEIQQFESVVKMANRACREELKDNPLLLDQCGCQILATSPTYSLTFEDEYADIDRIKAFQKEMGMPENELPRGHLKTQCIALLNFERTIDNYHLPKGRKAFTTLFADLAEMITTAEIDAPLAFAVTDALIRLGAPANVVERFAAKGGNRPARKLQIKEKNGVDVNHKDLQECLYDWRVAAFLDSTFLGPSFGIITGTSWSESIEHLIGALYCCDGKARRAKADSDERARVACRDQLKAQVIDPLNFTLQQRVNLRNCYAIPENVLPWVYRLLSELLIDCFPEELPEWLDSLVANADGQWGMYTEGFRSAAFEVINQFTREKTDDELIPRLLGLLNAWRDHVLRGVENRHELVPEILRMIPIFAHLGAKEEAERLYQRLLSVSMGPTWYKEDQLCIMTKALGSISICQEVVQRLPKVAGYLERASGEMTFQRFVRAEKSALLGQIARQGKYRAALAYFRRQCCGTTAELWAEAQQGSVDMVGPLKGNRFPGGALDDQDAILSLISNSASVSWTLRWALLEIFHCGDDRHLADYAAAFAKIANQVGALPELVSRVELVVNAETPSDARASFASGFRNKLKPELHTAFATVLVEVPPAKIPEPPAPLVNSEINDDDADDRLFHPGVFGRRSALREADKMLAEAEKQWSLGNRKAAKTQAIKVLQITQEGDWGIWSNAPASVQRAEVILVQEEVSAAKVISYYAQLIEAERYVPKWIFAEHLIGRVGSLLSWPESQQLLDAVIDHFRLVVGDAQQEIQSFDFLADEIPELNPDVEFFRFIVWLCNHPQWLRRDRAAAMLLWLVDQVPELFTEAVTTAFSMDEGYGADVLCGVLDGASAREPAVVWERIAAVLDLTKVTQELRHISRMVVLERLATRGDKAGSSSAKSALGLIGASFTGRHGTDDRPTLPVWAHILTPEWERLQDYFDSEAIVAWENQLAKLCSPLAIIDTQALEKVVSNSFRENHRPLDRWESKLRHALNLALWQYVSRSGARDVEAALRNYNPSQPEQSVLGMSNAFTDELLAAVESGNYSAVFGSNEIAILSYHDMAMKPTEDGIVHIEVLCILRSNLIPSGFELEESFRSSELPQKTTVKTSLETCCHLEPEVLFFGSFTPAIPLPFFQKIVDVKDEDFTRKNWRFARRNKAHGFGQPERNGCSLSVPRNTLKIPPEFKLAWIVWIDDKVVAIVDEHNNQLI